VGAARRRGSSRRARWDLGPPGPLFAFVGSRFVRYPIAIPLAILAVLAWLVVDARERRRRARIAAARRGEEIGTFVTHSGRSGNSGQHAGATLP
jgi:hypothetical protein